MSCLCVAMKYYYSYEQHKTWNKLSFFNHAILERDYPSYHRWIIPFKNRVIDASYKVDNEIPKIPDDLDKAVNFGNFWTFKQN